MSYVAPYIDAEGLHLPSFEDRLEALQTVYASVFGVTPDEDDPDGQLLNTLARALDDASILVDQVFQARKLLQALGVALDFTGAGNFVPRRSGEADADYRKRIAYARPAAGCARRECLENALRSLPYMRDVSVIENVTDTADADGIPAHSVACVVYGGTNTAIAQTIFDKKSPGIVTYGALTYDAVDADGNPQPVRFSRASSIILAVVVRIRHLDNWDDATEPVLKQALLDYLQSLPIGTSLYVGSLYSVCYGAVSNKTAQTFFIGGILTSSDQGAHSDVYPCAWNERITALDYTVTFEEIT